MKLVAIAQKYELPENMPIDGKITIKTAYIKNMLNMNNELESFKLILNISVKTSINSFDIDEFDSTITHTLSDEEFRQFINNQKQK